MNFKTGDMVRIDIPRDMPEPFLKQLVGLVMEQPNKDEDKYIVSVLGRLRLIDGDQLHHFDVSYTDCLDNINCDEVEE